MDTSWSRAFAVTRFAARSWIHRSGRLTSLVGGLMLLAGAARVAAAPLNVVSADAIGELAATPDRRFDNAVMPWLDPDDPIVNPALAPLLFYQVEGATTPIYARRVGVTVELSGPVSTVACAGSGGSGGPSGTSADLVMRVLGTDRAYHRHVPADYDPTRAYPLLIFYHGLGGDHDGALAFYGMVALAEANDFIVLFPNSRDLAACGSIPGGKHWDVCENPPNLATSQDIVFTRQLIAETAALYNVCDRQLYTHGHSYGGYFSYYLAVSLADEIAAFAEHSGGMLGFGPGICWPRCLPGGVRKIPSVLLHSTDDSVVPYSSSVSLDDALVAAGHETWFITLTGLDHNFDRTRNQAVWDWLVARPLP